MEAYTLWWNERTLQEMLDYNMKYSPITNSCTLLWQGAKYGKANMTCHLETKSCEVGKGIMNVVHHCGILHNDLSKDNIMLHFSPNELDGMCNWGEARRL
jgi:hypothetical protein